MPEIDLLKNYPKSKRKIATRVADKTPQIRRIARKFGKEFFDGDRKYGYGGYHYHPKYWGKVVKDFRDYYKLSKHSRVLDVGCAKGFMLYDLNLLIPGIHVEGIDFSRYALQHALADIKPFIKFGNAKSLPYPDKSFDLVISINTIHNLPRNECMQAIKEIQRVTKHHAFITVDAYQTEIERKRMFMWNLTARTILSQTNWEEVFRKSGFSGDYYWFKP